MDYPVKWIPAVFFTKGRERPVRRIVLHWMATNLAGCDATFTAGKREASAHYGLEGGARHQYVKEADTAWHSGVRTINHESIGIEHSAQPGRDATEATIANSIALCTDLCRRYGLTADAIDKHSDFKATQCPGTLPVSRIREAVRANLTPRKDDDDMTPEQAKQLDELHDRVFGIYPQRYGTVDAKGVWSQTAKDAPGAKPARGLDEGHGNYIVQRILAATVDPAAIARAVAAALPVDAPVDVDELARAIVLELGRDQ
jgi:hypothetical protein